MSAAELLRAHVARHNEFVCGAALAELAALFRDDAVVEFLGVAAGPFVGQAAITGAFREYPPDDELVLEAIRAASSDIAEGRYRWRCRPVSAGGTLRIRVAAGLIARMEVTVDSRH